MLINAGISEIIVCSGYPDKLAMDFLKQAKIRVRQINKGKRPGVKRKNQTRS